MGGTQTCPLFFAASVISPGMAKSPSDDLFPDARNPKGTHVINERCRHITRDGHRVVLVSGIPIAQYALGDHMSEAHAMVSLIDLGWADQNDVAEAFGCSARTLRRHQRRFEEGGLAALGRPGGYPPGLARLATSRQSRIKELKALGCSHHEMARQLGVSVRAVRKTLRRLGWKAAPPAHAELPLDLPSAVPPKPPPTPSLSSSSSPASGGDPNLSAFSATAQTPLPSTFDTDPSDRWTDRLFARLGLLEDAAPLFGSATAVPRAGVLLALPVLVASGVFECAQKVYGTLGPAFYGLRTSVLTLLLMALWRIKRPEGLKEHSPRDLGRVLGLDRAPEVKTLRRKLARLAAIGRAAQFGRALAEQRVARRGAALGFLYIDGHVRVYHGEHRCPTIPTAKFPTQPGRPSMPNCGKRKPNWIGSKPNMAWRPLPIWNSSAAPCAGSRSRRASWASEFAVLGSAWSNWKNVAPHCRAACQLAA